MMNMEEEPSLIKAVNGGKVDRLEKARVDAQKMAQELGHVNNEIQRLHTIRSELMLRLAKNQGIIEALSLREEK